MKRMVACLLLAAMLLSLCGCSALLEREYAVSEPHSKQYWDAGDSSVLRAANHQDLVKIAGNDAAAGYFFVSPPLPQDLDSEMARDFLAAYKAKYNSVPVSVWAVLAGDAYKVLERGLADGKKDGEELATWLHTLQGMSGLSGTLGFDAKGDRVGKFYRTYVVDANGKFVLQAE